MQFMTAGVTILLPFYHTKIRGQKKFVTAKSRQYLFSLQFKTERFGWQLELISVGKTSAMKCRYCTSLE